MLVHLPIALGTLASACDGLTLLGIDRVWSFGWWCLIVGLGAAVPAMAAGLADFARLPERAVPTALRHMGLMGAAWTMELIALLTRSEGLAAAPEPASMSIAAALSGFILLGVGAWHGGQLVYRFGAGVEQIAGD